MEATVEGEMRIGALETKTWNSLMSLISLLPIVPLTVAGLLFILAAAVSDLTGQFWCESTRFMNTNCMSFFIN